MIPRYVVQVALAFSLLLLSSCGSAVPPGHEVPCTPHERSCDGDYLIQCNASGDKWVELHHCEGGCQNGACIQVGVSCPEDQDCTGLECGPDPVCGMICGTCGDGQTCEGGICVEDGTSCSVCTPDVIGCDEDGNVVQCDADGCGWTVIETCPADEPCSDGTCGTEGPAACELPWGGYLPHGESVTAYQASSVPYGEACESETLECNDGVLSSEGYDYPTCEPAEEPIPDTFTVTLLPEPADGGTVTGGGAFDEGAEITIFASANADYTFEGWFEGDALFSDESNHNFTVTRDIQLTAHFWPEENFSSSELVDRGYVLTRDDRYNYAPSIMLDDGVYRMWWCGKDDGDGDSIYYAESSNGMNWGEPQLVLQAVYGGEQGHWACDPSVVKASNNYYYLFFTSEHPNFWETDQTAPDNQIFLAFSPDGINWNHANGRDPVIPLPEEHRGQHYGIGQSSVIFMENRFIHFYSYVVDPHSGPWGTYVSQSTDGGITFTPLNNGEPISSSVDLFSSVDAKYLPEQDKFLLVVEGPQWEISFRLLDRDFNIVGKYVPSTDFSPEPWNHNPGLLGDERGFVVNEEMVPVFFGSGEAGFENAGTWDIRRADLYIGGFP